MPAGVRRGFWAAVRAETGVTWRGRFRWLWLAAAIAVEAVLWAAPENGFSSWGFQTGCWLALGPPVWLCADLLSTQFKANPEPLRQWRPSELLARAIGRLAPYSVLLFVWIATLTGRFLVVDLLHPAAQPAETDIKHWGQLPGWWASWISVFFISGLPYIAVAALLSATARRPRRIQICLGVLAIALGIAVVHGALTVPTGAAKSNLAAGKPVDLSELWGFLMAPNFWAGGSMYISVWESGRLPAGWNVLPGMCWVASAGFVLLAIPPVLLTWWVAARRCRRHPHTVHTGGGVAGASSE